MVWNPGCEQVDAFSVSWAGENNWLVPPIYLIPKVLRHVVLCKATGTIVVPHWISAPFWPLLFDKDSFCANFVADILDFSGIKTFMFRVEIKIQYLVPRDSKVMCWS